MQVKVTLGSLEHMALNSLELRAAELLHENRSTEAVVLLDSQLEYDPSRAGVALALAKNCENFGYIQLFEDTLRFYNAGYSDAYLRTHRPQVIQSRRNIQDFYEEFRAKQGRPSPFDVGKPPPYDRDGSAVKSAAQERKDR